MTFSTEGRHNFHVPLTTVRHLLSVWLRLVGPTFCFPCVSVFQASLSICLASASDWPTLPRPCLDLHLPCLGLGVDASAPVSPRSQLSLPRPRHFSLGPCLCLEEMPWLRHWTYRFWEEQNNENKLHKNDRGQHDCILQHTACSIHYSCCLIAARHLCNTKTDTRPVPTAGNIRVAISSAEVSRPLAVKFHSSEQHAGGWAAFDRQWITSY